MNKHYRSSLQLIIVVAITLLAAKYWLDLPFGYGIVLFLGTVIYTIYRDIQAARAETRVINET